MPNPITRNTPVYRIRELGPVSRFQFSISGTVSYQNAVEFPPGTVQGIPLPGQTPGQGPSATEFGRNDGPNWFVIKRLYCELWLTDYWVNTALPADTRLTPPGFFIGLTDQAGAGRVLPEYAFVNRYFPVPGKPDDFNTDPIPNFPAYGIPAIGYETNTGGAFARWTTRSVTRFGTSQIQDNQLITQVSRPSIVEATEPHHASMSEVLSPLDWLQLVISGGTLASTSGSDIPVDRNYVGGYIQVSGYFSPRYSDLIPYIT